MRRRLYPLKRLALWAAVPVSFGGLWGLSHYLRQQQQQAPVPAEMYIPPGGSVILEPQFGVSQQVKLSANTHTAKWNVCTTRAKDLFAQGRLDEAEKYFIQAIEEAKKGFGEEDAHVASSLNNLAELYRLKKEFDKAEPLYHEAVDRLKESMGPEHPSVAFALHNLGGFYLLQNDFTKSIDCYERALKIKGRGLGLNHPDYANTMFHLGKVMQMTGKLNEAENLIRHSIEILEEGGFGQSQSAIRRMVILAEILVQSNQLQEAETLQRKILHCLEITQGPEAPSTTSALESLAATLLLRENFDESEEILKRCLEIKQRSSSGNPLQVWEVLFKLACVTVGRAARLVTDSAQNAAIAEYDKAMTLLEQAIGIAQTNWREAAAHAESIVKMAYLLPLVQSLSLAGVVGVKKLEATGNNADEGVKAGEEALRQCLELFGGENAAAAAGVELVRERINCTEQLAKLMRMLHGNTTEVEKLKKQGSLLMSEMKKKKEMMNKV